MQVNYELLDMPVLAPHDRVKQLVEVENRKACFVTYLYGLWLSVDNRKGDAVVNRFESFNEALAYLNEKNDC